MGGNIGASAADGQSDRCGCTDAPGLPPRLLLILQPIISKNPASKIGRRGPPDKSPPPPTSTCSTCSGRKISGSRLPSIQYRYHIIMDFL
jgi:hypothetical protein